MKKFIAISAVCLALVPMATQAHNAGASENLTVNGSSPTDRAHQAVRTNGHGNHPNAEFDHDSRLDKNPNAN